jgi:hypothetical protein
MTPVTILCEGPTCNGGFSAADRESTILGRWPRDHQHREDVQRDARRETTAGLHYQPHVRVGVGRRGGALFACQNCGHERVYGGSMWDPYVGATETGDRYQ